MAELKYVESNEFGCDDFKTKLKGDKGQSPIAIVRRGECSFVSKVRNVEHGGAKLAIIVDEVDNENPQMIIMVDDGTGNGIQIPSIMIGKTEGEKLIKRVAELSADNKQIQIVVKFEMNRPDDRVEYEFWFSSSNDRGLDFIRDFRTYHEKLGKKLLLVPRYFSWACINCDDSITETDCFCDGLYCAMDENNLRVSGRDIIHENLRQKCIYDSTMTKNKNDSLWWDYVTKAHSRWYDDFTADCSEEIHKELGIKFEDTTKCVDSSFTDTDHSKGDNTILSAEAIAWNSHGAHYIPSVIINSVAYRGVLDPDNVFNAICNGYKDPQEECKGYLDDSLYSTKDKVTFNWFIIVIIFLIILNVALLLIWKKINQRSMKGEVTEAVNDYMKLRQGGQEMSDKA